MIDFQRSQLAAMGSACLEKGITLHLTAPHILLLREAAQALHRATEPGAPTPDDMNAWLAAAERLAVALVAHLESLEEASQ